MKRFGLRLRDYKDIRIAIICYFIFRLGNSGGSLNLYTILSFYRYRYLVCQLFAFWCPSIMPFNTIIGENPSSRIKIQIALHNKDAFIV